jgi:hypothetical protein
MDGAQCVKKSSQVEDQMGSLALSIERALSLRADFEKRLSCILKPEETQKEIEKATKELISLVPLATALSEFNLKMNIINSQLESILYRIEL